MLEGSCKFRCACSLVGWRHARQHSLEIPMPHLARHLQDRFRIGCPEGWIEKLENAGLTSLEAIRAMTEEQCRALKLDPRRVASMQSYLRRN